MYLKNINFFKKNKIKFLIKKNIFFQNIFLNIKNYFPLITNKNKMSKEIEFYDKNSINEKTKFYRYMDSLVSHKTFSRIESIMMIIIFYTQLITGFFSQQVGILKEDIIPDKYLMLLQKIIRIRDLFESSYNVFCVILVLLFIFLIIFTMFFPI